MPSIRPHTQAAAGCAGLSVASVLYVVVLWFAGPGLAYAANEPETMAERSLKRIAEKQRELFGQAAKQGEKLDEANFRTQLQTLVHGLDAGLAANPAARRREDVARQTLEVDGRARREQHVDDVLRGGLSAGVTRAGARAANHVEDIIAPPHDSLAHEKAGGEFPIVAGSSHDHGEAAPGDANFQRLLHRHHILGRDFPRAFDASDRFGTQRLAERHALTKAIRAGAATLFANVFR